MPPVVIAKPVPALGNRRRGPDRGRCAHAGAHPPGCRGGGAADARLGAAGRRRFAAEMPEVPMALAAEEPESTVRAWSSSRARAASRSQFAL